MPRFVIDANMAGSPQLASWLAKNPTNIALISTAFAIEAYRRRQMDGIRQSYSILARHPKQLRVVKNQEELCRLHTRSKGMASRMLDKAGSKDLLHLCRGLNVRSESAIESALAPLIHQADEQLERLQQDTDGLGAEMAAQIDRLQPSDLRALRTGAPYTSELIRDLLEQVISTTAVIMTTIPGCHAPSNPADLIWCFPCRLVLCGALALRARARKGNIAATKPDRLRNDLVDAQHIAIGLYFDGLLTNDRGMQEVYEEAKIITSLLDQRQRLV